MTSTDQPPCRRDPRMFASPLLADHRIAREWCKGCPAAMFAACRDLAREQKDHDGTWAAVLYVNGKPAPKGKRFLLDQPTRVAIENSMFTADEAREAHAAWGRGLRDDRTRIGERVYQRNRKAGIRKRAVA